ncbi:ANTAR domain-containing protein [Vibrio sp. SM6]|uniref:ANTAR domain-containing protein n=1 Tax=Vibrio agarilyticus TaxID=2726741 RepID=A0A7X8TUE9_9VIBR|nr:ANTAR domain-containing protein [Vibrio agarilyticus]NLS14717.1 ANTAR domain-containing protein [Vibrio agarilyticus]
MTVSSQSASFLSQTTAQTPIIVCCDTLAEQARLSGLLSQGCDNIVGCRLSQFERLLERESNASVVVSWQQPCAELRLIIEFCRQKSVPLLLVLKQLSSNDINRLCEKMDYVILPADSDFDLLPWLDNAKRLRASFMAMEHEIAQLTDKIEERKVVEKAKGLLVKIHQVSEEEAYHALRKSAMQSSQSLAQVAQNVITTCEVLV